MTDTSPAPSEQGQALERELATIAETVNGAARLVENGGQADLGMLGARVETVCAALLSLPPIEARAIGARLPAIAETLDGIARTLTERGVISTGAPDSQVSPNQAARAYGASMARGRR
jgi:hypothetical protein